jgi:hypothetical protein
VFMMHAHRAHITLSSRNRVVAIEPTFALVWNSQFQATVGNVDWAHGGVTYGAYNKAYMSTGSACSEFSAALSVMKGNIVARLYTCFFNQFTSLPNGRVP